VNERLGDPLPLSLGPRRQTQRGLLGLSVLLTVALTSAWTSASRQSESNSLAVAAPGGSLVARLQMPPGAAAPAPLVAGAVAKQAAEIVLSAGDVGPSFVLAASSDRQLLGETTRTQYIVRAGRLSSYVEPDGLSGVSSFAVVATTASRAQDIFTSQARDFRSGSQELPLPPIGDNAVGVVQWSPDPIGGGLKSILIRRGNVVGYLVAGSYEAPTHLNDLIPLAELMAERAAQ
jgi:hypothetical protein